MIGQLLFNIISFPTRIEMKKTAKKLHKEKLSQIMTEDNVVKYIIECCENNSSTDVGSFKREAVEAYLNNLNMSDKKEEKAYKRINDLVLRRSKDLVGSYNTGDIDSDLEKKINSLYLFFDQLKYTKAAEYSQKLINYAIWVSTDEKAIGLTNFDKATKEFINAICKCLHADMQYKNVGYSDLELYDPWISGWNNQRFLINLDRVKRLGNSISMQERINRKNAAIMEKMKNTPGANPIFYGSNLTNPIHYATPNQTNTLSESDTAIDTSIVDILENAVTPFVEGRDHWFEKANETNCYKFFLRNTQNGIPEEYKLIIGYHGKDVVSLIVINHLGMNVVINLSAYDLVNRIFNNYFYQISDTDTIEASMYQSEFFWIYNLLDFSNIPESEIKENRLDIKLNLVFGALQQRGVDLSNVRYRFENYNSVNNFTLISDTLVTTSFGSYICDNSVIIVKDNEACYRLNNKFETVSC